MKIGILGAGALGTLFGQRLARDNDVLLLERVREVVDAIRADGLRVDGESRAAYATGESRDLFDVQILFIFVRATDRGTYIGGANMTKPAGTLST